MVNSVYGDVQNLHSDAQKLYSDAQRLQWLPEDTAMPGHYSDS